MVPVAMRYDHSIDVRRFHAEHVQTIREEINRPEMSRVDQRYAIVLYHVGPRGAVRSRCVRRWLYAYAVD